MIEAIKNRHSHRKFENRKVKDEKLKEILQAAAYSPSARAAYPWCLIVIRKEEVKKTISEATPYASFVADAPTAIAVASKETDEWVEDCSIVAEHIQLEATEQGLGACWAHIRGHEREDGEKAEEIVKDLLSLPDDYRILCTIALGYPTEEKPSHEKSEVKEREIYDEEYGNEY